MNFRNSLSLFAWSLIILLFAACGEETSYPKFEGEWDIIEAKRNGRTTQTLENVYFRFSKDSIVYTNILGGDQSFKIEFDYPEIYLESSQLQVLNVINKVQDTLHMRTKIGNFQYDLELVKASEK